MTNEQTLPEESIKKAFEIICKCSNQNENLNFSRFTKDYILMGIDVDVKELAAELHLEHQKVCQTVREKVSTLKIGQRHKYKEAPSSRYYLTKGYDKAVGKILDLLKSLEEKGGE